MLSANDKGLRIGLCFIMSSLKPKLNIVIKMKVQLTATLVMTRWNYCFLFPSESRLVVGSINSIFWLASSIAGTYSEWRAHCLSDESPPCQQSFRSKASQEG